MGARRPEDTGFSLIEMLLIMIVIGILAAIAIPLFLTQRAKAHDTSTQADVSALGKELAAYFVDGTGPVTLDFAAQLGSVVVSDGSWSSTFGLTEGTGPPAYGESANLDDPKAWCVALTNPAGRIKDFSFSAKAGLAAETC